MGRWGSSTFFYGTSDVLNDGIHVWGRLSAFSGTVGLAFQIVAMFTSQWSVTNSISMTGALEDVVDISFGLQEYCVTSPVPNFHGGFSSCKKYTESVEFFVSGTNQSYVTTGCDLFADGSPCDKLTKYAQICGAVSIVIITLGSVFSEKVTFNGAMQGIASVLGLATIALVTEFQTKIHTGSLVEPAFSFALFICGTACTIFGAIGAVLDNRLIGSRKNLWEDGIFMFGRVGSLLAVTSWVFVVLALSSNDWTVIDELGSVGGLCVEGGTSEFNAACSNNRANLGLVSLCVSTGIPLFGNTSQQICMRYTQDLQVFNATVLTTPYALFASYQIDLISKIVFGAIIAGTLSAVGADVFNEKQLAAAVLLGLTVVANLVALIAWVAVFERNLAVDVESLESGAGIYYLGCSVLVSVIGAIFMYLDFKKAAKQTGDYPCCGCQCA